WMLKLLTMRGHYKRRKMVWDWSMVWARKDTISTSDRDYLSWTLVWLDRGRQQIPGGGVIQSLEILDVSNNKIKAFPERPGTLVNLKVLHLGENRITALPSYFPGFRALELLIIDQNPIEWPPPHVLSANANSTDAQVAARWVSRIQGWIRDHLARHERSSIDDSSSDWRPE
ncbi:6245_t:CDS:2, partial [Acaulospora colombiana]